MIIKCHRSTFLLCLHRNHNEEVGHTHILSTYNLDFRWSCHNQSIQRTCHTAAATLRYGIFFGGMVAIKRGMMFNTTASSVLHNMAITIITLPVTVYVLSDSEEFLDLIVYPVCSLFYAALKYSSWIMCHPACTHHHTTNKRTQTHLKVTNIQKYRKYKYCIHQV